MVIIKKQSTGTYDLQVKSTASDALKITSVNGGISLNSGSSVGQEILINSHVKFNNILYYTPEILTSIGDTTTEGGGGAIGNKRKILSSNVLTILACDNGSINPAPTDPNWYCVVPDGTYNGQLKKVVLHPIWDSSSNGAVNIAINRFCDPDGSIYTSNYISDATNVAQIILNKGGQSINLIYVDDDNSNHSTTGYWMLLDNNFDFI